MDFISKNYKPDFVEIHHELNLDPRAKVKLDIITDFVYDSYDDVVIKGGELTGFWNGSAWIMSKTVLVKQIDACIAEYRANVLAEYPDIDPAQVRAVKMRSERGNLMKLFEGYLRKFGSELETIQFNKELLFADAQPDKLEYSTYKLPYTPTTGPMPAFDKLFDVLYEPEELQKFLWIMGALFTNNMKKIEKFLFIYGARGTGKGTMLKIINMLGGDYISSIDLRQFTGSSEFASADVKEVPILIDTDSDLSRITNEQNLLKLTSHEPVMIRKLYKQGYPLTFDGLLVTASNERFRLKNADSGIVRRALVMQPSAVTLPYDEYMALMANIKYEIPYIAQRCIDTFNKLGGAYYRDDIDIATVEYNDKVFKFVRENAHLLKNGIAFADAVDLYKTYLEDIGWNTTGAVQKLESDLHLYYENVEPRKTIGGRLIRNFYEGFKWDKVFPEKHLETEATKNDISSGWLDLKDADVEDNKLNKLLATMPAQYANESGTPSKGWSGVTTKTQDIDTAKLHYILTPPEYIVIDFDIKDENGEKDLDANIKAASEYPPTYAEVSKSGGGLHLHYIYDGDTSDLLPVIDKDIECKVYNGNSSLRRKLIKTNNLEIAHIASGLPRKEQDPTMFADVADIEWTENKLNAFINKALLKEHHGATKPEIDFIHHVIKQAEEAGVKYDLSQRMVEVLQFGMQSTHHGDYCKEKVADINWCTIDEDSVQGYSGIIDTDKIVFFDVEVASNVFIICWSKQSLDILTMTAKEAHAKLYADIPDYVWDKHESWTNTDKTKGVWYNPSPEDVAWLIKQPLAGFNSLGYDNHILYHAARPYTNEQLFQHSQNLISNGGGRKNSQRWEAMSIGYIDVFEMINFPKQSLKKWEIDLKWPHDEFELDWDKPIPEELWGRCAYYCMNDVGATEWVFLSKAGQESYTARKIMTGLAGGMSPITKGQKLSAKFLFGNDRDWKREFNWYDLAKEFPGYTFDKNRKPMSLYKGLEPSEGGYVYSTPGIHKNTAVLDIESLHPTSTRNIKYFGKYEVKYDAMVDFRLHVKHGDLDKARHAFDIAGDETVKALQPYMEKDEDIYGLAQTFKIIINIIYGMTSAPWPNDFKTDENIDNIIAKRGALFMIELQLQVQAKGYTVVHIKTDSIKIADADDEIIKFCMDFANQYGYKFAHEHTYEKIAIVNDSTLIAKIAWPEDEAGKWEAVAVTFKQPYVYKTVFSKQEIEIPDLAILKESRTGPIYLGDTFVGKNANIIASKRGFEAVVKRKTDIAPSVWLRLNKTISDYLPKRDQVNRTQPELEQLRNERIAKEVGCTVEDVVAIASDFAYRDGSKEYIIEKDSALTGTKGYKWETARDDFPLDRVDMRYYQDIREKAIKEIFRVASEEDANWFLEETGFAHRPKPVEAA